MIQNIRGLASMVYKFFDKKSSGGGITNEPKNYISLLLENFKKEKHIHHLETIFGA